MDKRENKSNRCCAVMLGKRCRATKNVIGLQIGSGLWGDSMFYRYAGVIQIYLCPRHWERKEDKQPTA